jgi:hypothetical protein
MKPTRQNPAKLKKYLLGLFKSVLKKNIWNNFRLHFITLTYLCIYYIIIYLITLILRNERRLRVFENRVLRRIFVQKRDEVTDVWRKVHNEELHNLFPSPSIIKMIKSRRMR